MLGKLKNWVFEEVPETQQPAAMASTVAKSEATIGSAATIDMLKGIVVASGTIDQKVLEHLLKTIEEANLPGADYFEFKKSLDGTSSMQLSVAEEVRYKMVFATMSASGELTKEKLVETAKHYVGVLEAENVEFAKTVEGKIQAEIGSREKMIAEIDSQNQEKASQIEALTKEIQENNLKRGQLQNEIITENSNIEQKKKNFEVTFTSLVNQINQDIVKIQTHI